MVDTYGHCTRLSHDECGTLWFHRFMEGMSNRMGKVHLPNLAFSTSLLLRFLQEIEDRIIDSDDTEVIHDWTVMSV